MAPKNMYSSYPPMYKHHISLWLLLCFPVIIARARGCADYYYSVMLDVRVLEISCIVQYLGYVHYPLKSSLGQCSPGCFVWLIDAEFFSACVCVFLSLRSTVRVEVPSQVGDLLLPLDVDTSTTVRVVVACTGIRLNVGRQRRPCDGIC